MRRFGLIGYPLGHSFSSTYFSEKFVRENIPDCIYENYPIPDITFFNELVSRYDDLAGLNVTIPYKERIIPLLDSLDPIAAEVGAVNTIVLSREKGSLSLIGYNTDVYGFEQSLLRFLKPWHTSALVLGTGGASKAVIWVLKKLCIEYRLVSRKPAEGILSYHDISPEVIHNTHLIINCTPLGMYPETDKAPPLPYEHLTPRHFLYDLIYNPEKTVFLSNAEKAGSVFCNGIEMLKLQAEKAWEIWNPERK